MPGVEQLVYAHCVKIVLCVLHDALDALPGLRLFGFSVEATQRPRGPVDIVGALTRRRAARRDDGAGVRVDARSVRAFVDRVLEVEREAAGHAPIGAVERSLHHNVCTIVVNLAADAASTFRLGCFGHELKMDVAPTDALDAIDEENLRTRRRKHSRLFDEARVDALVARPSGIETRPLVAAGGGGSRPRRGGAGHVDIPRADGRPTDRAKLTNLAVAVSFKTATPTA